MRAKFRVQTIFCGGGGGEKLCGGDVRFGFETNDVPRGFRCGVRFREGGEGVLVVHIAEYTNPFTALVGYTRLMTKNLLLTVRKCWTCAAVAFLVLFVGAWQVAGAAPSIDIDSFIYDVGDTVELHATGVQKHAVYTITVTPQTGDAEQYREQSGADGAFTFSFVPDSAGDWQVELFGTNLTTTVIITAIELPAVVDEPVTATLTDRTITVDDPYGNDFTMTFPAAAGPVAKPVVRDHTVFMGVGNHVLTIDGGVVTERFRLPAEVRQLRLNDADELEATVLYSDGQTVTVMEADFAAHHVFDPGVSLYTFLQNEAQVVNVQAAYEMDPTNPFLWLYAAEEAKDSARAELFYGNAVDAASTFYEYGQLARKLYRNEQTTFAMQAMNRGIRDFTARNYSAALLDNDVLAELYGFPQPALKQAVALNNFEAAAFWLPFVQQLTTPEASQHRELLSDYAQMLQQAGQTERANDVRAFMGKETRFHIGTFFADLVRSLAANAWLAVVSMLIAALVLSLVLSSKYAAIRRLLREDGTRKPYFFLRYASFFEKVVLVLLLGLAASFTALSHWHDSSAAVDAIASGSLANPVAEAALPAGTDIMHVSTLHQLQDAMNGPWTSAVMSAFTDPAGNLLEPTFGVPTWAWYVIAVLYAVLTLVAVVFVFIPRPRVAKNVPRNVLYTILAIIFPGTTFADEFWGIVLLAPWAVIGLDRIIGLTGGASFIPEFWAYVLLGVIYVVNVLSFIPEIVSHRRRMKALTVEHPDLARRLGLRVRS